MCICTLKTSRISVTDILPALGQICLPCTGCDWIHTSTTSDLNAWVLGIINLNFPINIHVEWRQQTPGFWLQFKATGNVSALLKLRDPAVFLASFCLWSPCIHVHTLSWPESTPCGESGLDKLPHRNTSTHLCYTNGRWKHHCATKIFLSAGRQVVERLTLQRSPASLFLLRCCMLSGADWGPEFWPL